MMKEMWNSLMHFDVMPANLIIRAAVVYLSVLIMLRLGGKRQIGQMGATEFVAILLISNAVQNAMNGGDNSLIGGLVLASVLIILSAAISFLTFRSRIFSALFEGTPRVLIHNGKIVEKNRRKELLSISELHTLLRKQGIFKIDDIRVAILESDGSLSVFRYSDAPPMAP